MHEHEVLFSLFLLYCKSICLLLLLFVCLSIWFCSVRKELTPGKTWVSDWRACCTKEEKGEEMQEMKGNLSARVSLSLIVIWHLFSCTCLERNTGRCLLHWRQEMNKSIKYWTERKIWQQSQVHSLLRYRGHRERERKSVLFLCYLDFRLFFYRQWTKQVCWFRTTGCTIIFFNQGLVVKLLLQRYVHVCVSDCPVSVQFHSLTLSIRGCPRQHLLQASLMK